MVEGALAGLRVIEGGHMVAAAYAAKLMADLGAEVIKVEELSRATWLASAAPSPAASLTPKRAASSFT